MIFEDFFKPVRAWGTGECFIGPSRARRKPEVEVHDEEALATIQRLRAEMIERGKQFDAEKSQYRQSFKEQMEGLKRGLSQTLDHNERLKSENLVLKIKLARKEKLVEHDDARPLSDFEMSARAAMCLDKMGIKTIGQLLGHSRKDLLKIPNFGVGSANEIEKLLKSIGLKLS